MPHNDESSEVNLQTARALGRMVDFKIPLPWILGGAMGVASLILWMSFSLQQIQKDMSDLKAAITATTATAGRVQLLEFRIQTLEADVAVLKRHNP
jgi:hypothetical protein